jgi:hypothetical protein
VQVVYPFGVDEVFCLERIEDQGIKDCDVGQPPDDQLDEDIADYCTCIWRSADAYM